jgi:hypothetical protein
MPLTGYEAGDEVYVAEGGGWTTARPTGANSIVQFLGVVTKGGSGGKGLVLNPGPATLPNLQSGYAWVGNGTNQPTATLTSSLSVATAVSASFATSASFASTASFATNAATASVLLGTVASASYADFAVTAASATTATSSSYALTSSFAATASYAANAANIFPYTGAARITGSLSITGSVADSNVVSNYTDTFTSSDPISQIVTCTQAEYNSVSGSANASRTLYVITDATGGGQYVSGSLTSNVNALGITSNTASLDCQAGNFFTLALASGATTFVNPTNIQAGQTINLRITQSTPSTGSISFASSVKQVSGSAYTPTAVASAVDIVTFVAFDTSSLYLANIKNFV